MHKLQTKIIVALASVMLLLTLVITLASLAFSIRAATEHNTRATAEVIHFALTDAESSLQVTEKESDRNQVVRFHKELWSEDGDC
jgi:uncharacterized protein YhaN